MTDLRHRFAETWGALGCQGESGPICQQLLDAWSEPHRVHHGLAHLESCLLLFDEVASLAVHADEVEAALWFHDAVYDTRALDNEERSAAWASRAIEQAGGKPEVAQRVGALVRATRHHEPSIDGDAALVVDLDLAVLGFDRELFDAYELAVRQEYAWVEEPAFRAARIGVLRSLLNHVPLYRTPALRHRFEARAVENLTRSLARLCQGDLSAAVGAP